MCTLFYAPRDRPVGTMKYVSATASLCPAVNSYFAFLCSEWEEIEEDRATDGWHWPKVITATMFLSSSFVLPFLKNHRRDGSQRSSQPIFVLAATADDISYSHDGAQRSLEVLSFAREMFGRAGRRRASITGWLQNRPQEVAFQSI